MHLGRPSACPRRALYGSDASNWNPVFKAFHDRLRATGKKPKVVIVAVMRKMLTVLNAMVRDDLVWVHLSRRCGARTRQGSWCQSPAMPNGRCRLHGGKSPGAPKGNKNAFKHGRYAVDTIAARREIAALLRTMRTLVERC